MSKLWQYRSKGWWLAYEGTLHDYDDDDDDDYDFPKAENADSVLAWYSYQPP